MEYSNCQIHMANASYIQGAGRVVLLGGPTVRRADSASVLYGTTFPCLQILMVYQPTDLF